MKIIQPFSIEVFCNRDAFSVSSWLSDCDVQGLIAEDAVKSYLDELERGMIWLCENESTLSPVLHDRLAFLRQYIAVD